MRKRLGVTKRSARSAAIIVIPASSPKWKVNMKLDVRMAAKPRTSRMVVKTIGRPAPKLRAPSGSLRATNEELARERDTLKKWNDNLIAVNQLIQAISGTLSADEIVAIAAQRLAEFLSYDLFGATWWQPERVWVQTCGRVEPERAAATRSALLTRRRVRPGAEQTSSLGRSRRKAAPAHVAHRSWLIELPLTVAQEEYGLLRLEREHGTPFSAEDDAFLRDIAPSLAIALRNADVYTQVQNLAMTDGLTGLLNRRAFADHLARALRAGERYRAPTCLIMADLDHFKSVNDRLGHPGGDQVLKDVARLIGDAVRSVDIVARYGGEEFAMILPHTDLEPARVLAERIRKMLERHDFTLNGERTQITLSMGVARIPCSGIGKPEDWLAAADQALYRAKSAGRNRVVLSEGLEEAAPQVETNLFAVPTR